MTPYYHDEAAGIVIYHGDCRDVLPTLAAGSVDLVLTDPPYGVSFVSGFRAMPFGGIVGDGGELAVYEMLRPVLPTMKNGRHIYCFGLRDWGDLQIGGRAELIWDKELLGMGDLSIPWAVSHEVIGFGVYVKSKENRADGKGRLAARMRQGTVLRVPRVNGVAITKHPTEKPIALLRQLIEASSCLGEIVLDPYMGVGSTLVAARIEDRRAIGIEIEERYCEIAANRLRQGVLPLSLVSSPAAPGPDAQEVMP